MKRLRIIHPNTRNRAFTLIEIMIVVAIIALICAIALPGLVRARKRAQGVAIRTDLRLIDEAMDEYALENGRSNGSLIPVSAWKKFLKPGTRLYVSQQTVLGDVMGDQVLGILPPVPSQAWDNLIDVCDSSFWAPYLKGP